MNATDNDPIVAQGMTPEETADAIAEALERQRQEEARQRMIRGMRQKNKRFRKNFKNLPQVGHKRAKVRRKH